LSKIETPDGGAVAGGSATYVVSSSKAKGKRRGVLVDFRNIHQEEDEELLMIVQILLDTMDLKKAA
jgi:hypothetical protein